MEKSDIKGPREPSIFKTPDPMLDLQHPRPSKRSYASFLGEPSSLDTRVSHWLASVNGAESHSEIGFTLDHPKPAHDRPKSAPAMGQHQDDHAAQGVGTMLPPPTPSVTSAGVRTASQSGRSSSAASSGLGPRDPLYRQENLRMNHIYVKTRPVRLPQHVQDHVDAIKAKRRDSPELTEEALAEYLEERGQLDDGCVEAEVTKLVQDWVLPSKSHPSYKGSGLECTDGLTLASHLTPAYPGLPASLRVSQPKPDLVYGYSGSASTPFSDSQIMGQHALNEYPNQRFAVANSRGLRFPFFALELKADAGTFGSLWVATNQCAGDAAACLNAADRLNELLRKTNQPMIDNLTYCVAMDNQFAQLYVSWKPERLDYYMSEVGTYKLSYEEDFKEFRRHVRNILDWGKDKRLRQIKEALDVILEEDRKEAARAAKVRPPPSVSGSDDGSKRRRSSGSAKGGRA